MRPRFGLRVALKTVALTPDAISTDDSRGHAEGRRNASMEAPWGIWTFLQLRFTAPMRQYSSLTCGGDINLARSVLYLADKTSISTTSTANRKLAISENVSSNGCR